MVSCNCSFDKIVFKAINFYKNKHFVLNYFKRFRLWPHLPSSSPKERRRYISDRFSKNNSHLNINAFLSKKKTAKQITVFKYFNTYDYSTTLNKLAMCHAVPPSGFPERERTKFRGATLHPKKDNDNLLVD